MSLCRLYYNIMKQTFIVVILYRLLSDLFITASQPACYYVWTLWSKHIEFALDLASFLLLFYVIQCFYSINFKPWHNDPQVLWLFAISFLSNRDSSSFLYF